MCLNKKGTVKKKKKKEIPNENHFEGKLHEVDLIFINTNFFLSAKII